MTSTVANADPVVGVYDRPSDAESAVKVLARAAFDPRKQSVIGKVGAADAQAFGFYTTREGPRAWGAVGGFWGAVWRLLEGASVFVLPSVGLVAAAGPIGDALVVAFEGAPVAGGVSALSGALAHSGVASEQAVRREADVLAGRFLLIVHGSDEDIDHARDLLAAARASGPLPFHQAA